MTWQAMEGKENPSRSTREARPPIARPSSSPSAVNTTTEDSSTRDSSCCCFASASSSTPPLASADSCLPADCATPVYVHRAFTGNVGRVLRCCLWVGLFSVFLRRISSVSCSAESRRSGVPASQPATPLAVRLPPSSPRFLRTPSPCARLPRQKQPAFFVPASLLSAAASSRCAHGASPSSLPSAPFVSASFSETSLRFNLPPLLSFVTSPPSHFSLGSQRALSGSSGTASSSSSAASSSARSRHASLAPLASTASAQSLPLSSPLFPCLSSVPLACSAGVSRLGAGRPFADAPRPPLGEDDSSPPPSLTLTEADLAFYRELGVSPEAPWWEVQQAFQVKHDQLEDEKKQTRMQEAFEQVAGKRFNQDFLAICRKYDTHRAEAGRPWWRRALAWTFGRSKRSVSDLEWFSGFPSEEDPLYMSQVDAPKEIKDIMMGLGDRSGVFRDVSKLDRDPRPEGLFRRFEVERLWSTGGFFVPLSLASLSSPKLITPALTTAFGLAASTMARKDGLTAPEAERATKRFQPPSLRTLLWTGGLLALHGCLGVISASALLSAIGRLPLGLRAESVVSAAVILQWWLTAMLYRTHEPAEDLSVEDDIAEDMDEEEDRPPPPHYPMEGGGDDSSGNDDLDGPLDE
ncbi:hypothetical protein BESB_004740 [Besnoitia besnoiti]|uniref:Uncharacterized protein n=1 Tax=Besnoitia besnoiti TaxID=94643 RepID=A0A2A9MPU7_BESBE|nr:hypothetical protein BESB_004740 [Besnoitia besnoiti]PFH38133.1 hypothetical protein BESB_004740 [Besnoitia besnoiti]